MKSDLQEILYEALIQPFMRKMLNANIACNFAPKAKNAVNDLRFQPNNIG